MSGRTPLFILMHPRKEAVLQPGPTAFRSIAASLLFGVALLAHSTPAHGQWPPQSLENLKVLPHDIAVNDLVGIMADFTRALGVRCTFCHVGEEGMPLGEYDFVSDEKPTKRKARQMLEMVNGINNEHLAGLEARSAAQVSVQCVTCHRGARLPRMLQDVLIERYDAAGIDGALAAYDRLREQYYGRFTYDFGEVPLVDAAAEVARRGSIPDAIRLLDLNVEMNPGSVFATTQLIQQSLPNAFMTGGIEAGRAKYAELRQRFGADGFPEPLLNTVGYSLLRRGRPEFAVVLFEYNVELYPEAWNAYDSLGEGLAAVGDVPGAIRAYERSLELNPDNANGAEKLRELRGRSS